MSQAKHGILLALIVLLAGCGPGASLAGDSGPGGPSQSGAGSTPPAVELKDYGPAPELTNQVWLNTDHPLRLADLRGDVILLEMWTFGCINCRHVIPSLRSWYETYQDQGLVVIGNHFPEFSYEADLDNLKAAVADLNVAYPVAQDNDGATWRAYKNQYWPTLYLIDRQGRIRYEHIGEGGYAETEGAIQALLAEPQ